MNPSKSPFDDPESPGKSGSDAGDASNATAIFGTVSAKPSASEDDDLLRSLMGGMKASKAHAEPAKPIHSAPPQAAPAAPAAETPAQAPSADPGGFTQMFQALQKPHTPSASGHSTGSGEFTDTFHSPQHPAPSAPATPAASAFTPPSTPSGHQSKHGSDLSSVFKQIVVEKTPSTEKPTPPAPPPPAKPGEFTQMLRTLGSSTQKHQHEPQKPRHETSHPAHTPPAAATPGSLTQMFDSRSERAGELEQTTPMPAPTHHQHHHEHPVFKEEPPPPASPGAFTQMFQQTEPSWEESQHQAPPVVPPPPASAPGSFTQMLQRAESNWEEVQPPPPPVAAPPPSGPGAFTQMFHQATPGRDADFAGPAQHRPAPSPESSGPGTFTQMFSPRAHEKLSGEDPLNSLKSEPPPVSSFQFSSTPSRPAEPMPPAQGGFTQLLHALNQEEPATRADEPFIAPQPPPPMAPAPAAGGFTQLLRTLSADPVPQPVAQPPLAPPMTPLTMPPIQQPASSPSMSGGPGEFTRVISGSQFREMQTQGPAAQGPPVLPQQPAARPGLPPMQFPPTPAFPQAPAMPQMPAAHGGAAPPAMPHFQPPAFQFPPAPAPPAAPQPPAPGKLQQYLPLILILNIFVLLVIVLILIFVLRHR